ncbi:MAG: ubiquinol-cytochrome c reductase iron-sulfur subunit [Planctomycetes bacterium]|nr:ubiquinol-cytochrome c reductase iron-sulfur subunit [Planctomycetota bacterium]
MLLLLKPEVTENRMEEIKKLLSVSDILCETINSEKGKAIAVKNAELSPKQTAAINALPEVAGKLGIDVSKDSSGISRREFINYCIGLGMAAISLGAAGTVTAYLIPIEQEIGNEDTVEVATEEEMKQLSSKKFKFGKVPSMLVKIGETFYASSIVCTHLSCYVEWDEKKKEFHCPCHNAAFDIRGNVLAGPPPSPLPTYNVVVNSGKIFAKKK